MTQRRDRWKSVLRREAELWAALTFEEIVCRLTQRDPYVYDVLLDGCSYQVEVGIVDLNSTSANVVIGVDDGSLPASLVPVTCCLSKRKDGTSSVS